jgi:outer membrane receptor protein involved in Fe transport
MWALAAIVALAIAAQAQTSRGTVSGTVTDPSGAVVAGVSVVLTRNETGARRAANSNEAGIYRFEAVDLGVYDLKVTETGFTPFLATGLRVEANRTATIDFRLEVGSQTAAVQVSAEAETLTVRDGPLRGGNFLPREVSQFPLIGLNPLSLARTLPGVIQPSGSFLQSQEESTEFSVNGQRVRGNNFLLDGTENNDIAFTGVAQPFRIADAVEEVSVQTGNYSVEFGRASGGVFNVVTKSGTNNLHGTLFWRYQSQRFNSVSNLDKLTGTPKSVFSYNVAGFTVGGPIRKDKTFFFAGFQQDTRRSTANFSLVVPTAAAVERLRSLFPSNPRLDLYLSTLGDLRGLAAPIGLPLGVDPRTGLDRGSVQFATAPLGLPTSNEGPQWLVRSDHHLGSEAHRLSWRYIYDSRVRAPQDVLFPGFILDTAERNQNFLFSDSYTFGPSYTNEFRFSYGRLHADQSRISPQSVPLAQTLPRITIQNISSPGVPSGLQFRHSNNLLFQETQTKLKGRHTFRYGVELLRQVATQQPNGYPMGEVMFQGGAGYSAFANFLDDFSGQSGRIRKTIGEDIFHPNQFRQSYFFQDTWKITPALTLTLGLRYENFGMVANVLRYPAFSGFDPERFFEPNRVNRDDNNFGPALGLAWSPSFSSGRLGKLFGERKTVWRGGYQISYQALYTQMISLDLATSTPNAIFADIVGAPTGRGTANWFARLPAATPRPPSLLDTQYGTLEENFRSPYTERWSFGFQRQLRGQTLLDLSYVGSGSHKLTTRADLNPGLDGARLHPDFGGRTVRTSQGNSTYHSLQARVDRRFAHGFQMASSYTWSKSLDSTSEGIGQVSTQYANSGLTSTPAAEGGLKLDRGVSDFHRGQRLTLLYLWELPGPSRGLWKQVMGGWSIAGITTFQSGTPYTIINGSDRNRDGWAQMDRPDIGNPNAPRDSRAVLSQGCPSGFRNPEINACVNPADVYWVEGTGAPNRSTVGRNTLFTGGTNNLDLSLFKTVPIRERTRLEFRWEAQNAFNHPQFTAPPAQNRNVRDAPGPQPGLPSRFLNQDFTNAGIRSMWVQVKVLF